MKNIIIFDFSGTIVKMRPAKLLISIDNLLDLKKRYYLAIITGGRKSEVNNILNEFKVKQIFNFIITKDDSMFRKPDKKLFNILSKNLSFNKAYYIGDTFKDYQFAKNANIDFLYIGKRKIGMKQSRDVNKLVKYLL